MKRPVSLAESTFHKLFPVFQWVECDQCHCEFRCEAMWRTETGPYYAGRGREVHYCRHCAPSKCDAIALLHSAEERIRKPRPPAPPPPPKPPQKRTTDH